MVERLGEVRGVAMVGSKRFPLYPDIPTLEELGVDGFDDGGFFLLIAPAGSVVESVGWPNFFLIALATGIPPLLMLPVLAPWNWEHPRGAATHTGEVTDDPAPPQAADKR